ncbi:mannosyl-oligosaccharide 1,2-alpha-mannosidase MNS3 [Iris pallida]|uniref:alpha-1,2-Mannosidase n=1 Tax=Iris pallida TaxID=29817 RepID=A0AAX6IBA1_IRIPA|nr:mannosyl-oligosaccharide 1,2-alpha-mannosidase MNS3 [Iris pallida]KAJ6850054.1 mannosyl-oligosaccharide 1,2-alpha-mannosidase MNS3 [Iris pallida]
MSSSSSKSLPYSTKDVDYDNAKFRHRSPFKVMAQALFTSSIRHDCGRCSLAKILILLMIGGLTYLMVMHKGSNPASSDLLDVGFIGKDKVVAEGVTKIGRLWRKPPRLPPRLSPDEAHNITSNAGRAELSANSEWISRQSKVKDAFIHAWSGYKKYAMGFDELMPLSRRGIDGLGGLGATIIDSLDTAMIMGVDEIVSEAETWIEEHLMERINVKGQVNLFETTIRLLGGLLSAYHLSGGEQGTVLASGIAMNSKEAKPEILLKTATKLADRLLSAFTSSPTPIPYSDVVLHDSSAHPAPDGLSSTSEVSTLQLEFNYLSKLSGDPKYSLEAMKTLEHLRTLPKMEGLVPIYISPHSGQFIGNNIRLGSRGDSYYEYLIKVWIQQKNKVDNQVKYLYEMYEEAMKGVRHLLVRKSIPKGLVFVGELPYGPEGSFSPKMDHLVCFLPGTLALGATKGITKSKAIENNLLNADDLDNLNLAEDLAKTCFEMYAATSTGLAPEIAYFHIEGFSEGGLDGGNRSSEYVNDILIKPNDRHNLLRPETVESLFVLHRITQNPKYREWGWQIFEAFEKYTKVGSGGYSSLHDVTTLPPQRRDKMETFFLGETLKYLYLLFGDNNVLPLDKYVFSTEAHPFPIDFSAD